jgi:hypothetical protein
MFCGFHEPKLIQWKYSGSEIYVCNMLTNQCLIGLYFCYAQTMKKSSKLGACNLAPESQCFHLSFSTLTPLFLGPCILSYSFFVMINMNQMVVAVNISDRRMNLRYQEQAHLTSAGLGVSLGLQAKSRKTR